MFDKLKEKYYCNKGQKLLAARKPEKAQKYLIHCVQLNDSAENLFHLALSYMALFQYQEAEEYLLKIYQQYPDNEINLLALLEALLLQRKWSRLEDIISAGVKKFSNSAAFNRYSKLALDPIEREKYVSAKEKYNLGFLELEKGNKTAALNNLQAALNYFGESPELLQNIGLIYYEMGSFKEAYEHFEKALTKSPGELQLQKLLIKTQKQLSKTQ